MVCAPLVQTAAQGIYNFWALLPIPCDPEKRYFLTGRQFQDDRHAHCLLHLRLLPRISHIRWACSEVKREWAGLVGYVHMTVGGILATRQGRILVSGLYKLLHSAIHLGEHGVSWENMENMKRWKHQPDDPEHSIHYSKQISMTENTLFVNQMIQNTIFYGI